MGVGFVTCSASKEKQFDMNQLLEDAPEFSQNMPADRELPWIVRVIQKPASKILFFVCDLWDRVHAKTTNLARSVWGFVWRKRMQEFVAPIYDNVSVQVMPVQVISQKVRP